VKLLPTVTFEIHVCLFYEKVNYCKIQSSIIKNCHIIW